MATSDIKVTVTVDDRLGKLLEEMATLSALQGEKIAELEDRLSALEKTQATPETIARQVRMTTNSRGL